MARFQKRKLSKKEQSAEKKKDVAASFAVPREARVETPKEKKIIQIPAVVSVKDFAEALALPVTTVISSLMKNGVLANINQNIDFETTQIIGDDLGFTVELKTEEVATEIAKVTITGKNLSSRPPVVAVMGHVDHGKTTLLDTIRTAQVAASESGGITQHISSFQINIKGKKGEKERPITFIDTPGHEAFMAMRAHGTAITDIVILVVAADDGIMPQTIEVINQAKKSSVPVVVAINKMDKPDADAQKVKQQLVDYGLTSEEWGGDTQIVEISAKTGKGIDKLLESVLLLADIKNYQANPKDPALGVVIESHMHKGSGPLALALIENGTIHKGEVIVVGGFWGKVRLLQDTSNNNIDFAGPSTPVRIAGLNGLPTFGDRLLGVMSEKEAREQAQVQRAEQASKDFVTSHKITAEGDNTENKIQDLNILVKADVKGSLEAIKQSLQAINHPEIKINIVHEGIGAISESDVNMASASKAILISFRVSVLGVAKRLAELESVKLVSYDVIYDLINFIKETASEMLPPLIKETENGKLRILAIFRYDRKKTIFGGIVESGELKVNDLLKIQRGEKLIYSGKIDGLRTGKDEAKSVESGSECGLSVNAMIDVLKDDIATSYKIEEIKRTIE